MFGPLVDGMLISKQLLGPLVRQTAINANRYVRLNTQGYENPLITRRRYAEVTVLHAIPLFPTFAKQEIAKRYAIPKEDELLLSEVVQQTVDKRYMAAREGTNNNA